MILDLVVSLSRGTPLYNPKIYSPYCGDPHKGANPEPYTLNPEFRVWDVEV